MTSEAKKFLEDRMCFLCGKGVDANSSKNHWCHRFDCQLEEEGVCSCALEVHEACCSDKCPFDGACRKE